MKVVFDAHVLEVIKNLPKDGYLFSEWEHDGLWYVNAGKPLVRPTFCKLGDIFLFTTGNYETIQLIDVHGFGKMTAMPVKMCIERVFCRE